MVEKKVEKKKQKMTKKGGIKTSEKTEQEIIKLKKQAEVKRKAGAAARKRKKAVGIPECLWTSKGSTTPVVWKRVAGKISIVSAS